MDLSKFLIALEADDITKEVADQMDDTNTSTAGEDVDSIDAQLDNISDSAGSFEEGDDADGEDSPTDESGNTDDGDDSSEDNAEEPQENAIPESKDAVFAKREDVKNNLVYLYHITDSEVKRISEIITKLNDQSTISLLNKVMVNLKNIKENAYKLLTTEIVILPYDQLLERYISLRRVYDISLEMVNIYFKDNTSSK